MMGTIVQRDRLIMLTVANGLFCFAYFYGSFFLGDSGDGVPALHVVQTLMAMCIVGPIIAWFAYPYNQRLALIAALVPLAPGPVLLLLVVLGAGIMGIAQLWWPVH
jgi:hypothetical protein